MKSALIAAAVLTALSPVSLALAQNNLPTTTVTAPKPKARHVVTAPTPSDTRAGLTATATGLAPTSPIGSPDSHLSAADAQKHFTYDPSVNSKDWNATAAINLHTMTDAQFAAFEMRHPTAVFIDRCFVGQDPDLAIRSRIRMYARPYASWCTGHGG